MYTVEQKSRLSVLGGTVVIWNMLGGCLALSAATLSIRKLRNSHLLFPFVRPQPAQKASQREAGTKATISTARAIVSLP